VSRKQTYYQYRDTAFVAAISRSFVIDFVREVRLQDSGIEDRRSQWVAKSCGIYVL
jgi:hypothetical protein